MRHPVFALPIALMLALTIGCAKDPAAEKKRYLDSGNRQFEQQHYRESIVEYQNALRIDGRLAEARVKSAEAYEKLGDDASALREYVRAADLLPKDADIQAKAAEFLLAAGMIEDASTRAQRAIDIKPLHIRARLLRALATAGLKGLDSAVSQVEEAIKMDPTEPSAFAQLGRFNLAQGNTKDAEKAFKSAYEVAPNSVDALLGLANFYMSTDLPGEAEQWLTKAREVAPKDKRVNRTLAALYIQTKRFAQAEAPLKAYAENDPNSTATIALADYYFQMNRRDDARRVLESIKDRDDAYVAVRSRLSILELTNGRLREAHKIIDEAIAHDPRSAQALMLKGRYLLLDAKFGDAVATLKRAVDSSPKSAESHYWLGVAYRNVGDTTAARAAFTAVQTLDGNEVGSKLQLSQLALQEGNAAAAVDFANQAVASHPANPQARLVLIDALIAKPDLSSALAEATRMAAAIPDSSQVQLRLGRAYFAQGNYNAAEGAFLRAAEISQGDDEVIASLVDAQIRLGKLKEARASLADAIAKRPKSAPLRLISARIATAERDPKRAEQALHDALSVDPSYVQAYVELSRMYLQGGRLDEALTQLEALSAKQPKLIWARTMIAVSLELQNRKDEARDQYRKILEIDPRAVIASNNLAMIYVNEGRNLDEARQLAETAVQQLPNSPEVYDTLGSVYLKQNLPALAVSQFATSVRNAPDNPMFHYHLGLALAQSGDKERARESIRRALTLGKPFDGIEDAKRVLAGVS